MTDWRRIAVRLLLLAALSVVGAIAAILLKLPIPLLIGPAVATTIGALGGLDLRFPKPLRNAVFLVAGVAIGATVSPASVVALTKWPFAFAILGFSLIAMVLLGRRLMQRLMGTDARSALLAATPGHLSYVIALGEDLKLPTERVAIVQSIRLLALTLAVPFAAYLAGIETGVGITPSDTTEMTLLQTALCLLAAAALAPLAMYLRIPAATLIAGMAVGAAARLTGFTPGTLSHWIAYPALAAIGALIGTRFVGINLQDLRQSAFAGLAGTTLAALITLLAALAAMRIVDMPLLHVLVAFAPGGLETMTVMGVAIGANPGFVAAAHVARLLLLSVLIPVMIGRAQGPLPAPR